MSRGSYHKSSSSRHSKHFDEKKKKAPEPTVSDPGLLNRTAWTNAAVALVHIKKVRKSVCKHRPLIETSESAILDRDSTGLVPPRHLLQHILPPSPIPPPLIYDIWHTTTCSQDASCRQTVPISLKPQSAASYFHPNSLLSGLLGMILWPTDWVVSGARWLYY